MDAASGTEVQLRVRGPAGGAWNVRRRDDGWAVGRGPAASATTAITIDADPFWRLCTRAIEPPDARQQADVRGDTRLADAALQLVSIIR